MPLGLRLRGAAVGQTPWACSRSTPVTGHCTLFLRLKRADWLAWADKNKVAAPSAEYAFHKPLDPKLGAMILLAAQRLRAGATGVHHPWVLALLCTMSGNDWLDYVVERDSSYDDPTNKIGPSPWWRSRPSRPSLSSAWASWGTARPL